MGFRRWSRFRHLDTGKWIVLEANIVCESVHYRLWQKEPPKNSPTL